MMPKTAELQPNVAGPRVRPCLSPSYSEIGIRKAPSAVCRRRDGAKSDAFLFQNEPKKGAEALIFKRYTCSLMHDFIINDWR